MLLATIPQMEELEESEDGPKKKEKVKEMKGVDEVAQFLGMQNIE
jgi:hypothetical protein